MTDIYSGHLSPLIAGGAAGTAVDITLYPLDTIKTRLQSSQGFRAAGGFRSIYNGIGPAALGSAPNAAVFFVTYEGVKQVLSPHIPSNCIFLAHATAASAGEVAACVIRVPVEIVKQRRQTQLGNKSSRILMETIRKEGICGMYRGYWSTLAREIPFSFIQYPLWEFFKSVLVNDQLSNIASWQSAAAGALAGGIAAAITTPLDVAKTRIMLASSGSIEAQGKIIEAFRTVLKTRGWKGLYAGIVPRSLWMSIGGFVYFGAYEQCRTMV